MLWTDLCERKNGPNANVWDTLPYVLAWEKENHFFSDTPGDRNDQLTEKEDLPSENVH